ncbi:hypothetical protein A3715_33965 [Oleiphilus sp. HI0009]|nr:hypothetical protein A3715_33965 [Oleiphilus sp. HI0009]
MGIEGKKYVCVSGKIRKKIKDGFCVESARTWESHPFVEQGAYYRDLFGPLVEYNYVATLGRDITQKLKYEFKHKRKETSAGNSGDISLNNIEFPEPVQWVIDNHPKSTFGIAVSLILIQLGLFLLGIHLKRKEEGAGQQKKGNRINYKKRKA